jgi:hypothetical protein
MAGDGARRVLIAECGGLRCKPSGVLFVSCSQLGVVSAVLAFFFYETDTPARVVSLKKFIPLILFDWDSTVPLGF